MYVDFLIEVFEEAGDRTALVWKGRRFSYAWLRERIAHWQERVREEALADGSVVALEGDFSPNTVALLLALIQARGIVVPLSRFRHGQHEAELEIARAQSLVTLDGRDDATIGEAPYDGRHELYDVLRERGHPGLVPFTSGSTGTPKAAVHDCVAVLEKFRTRRPAMTTLNFLLFDHMGGINTLLHTLSNGATIVTVDSRDPDRVCELIEQTRAELLPVTPTFLNLLLLGGAWRRHDLGSLKVISYGAEPMPDSTLRRLARIFPDVRLQQTYGLIEVGALRTKSRSNDSLWMRVGGEGFETRVVDGLLQIKARSAMLGYLNAPSPFTEDGWFMTGDAVEVDGDYIRVLGRKSELINVGGEKVYPAEVEGVIQEMDNVSEVTVSGEPNPIVGSMVVATVTLVEPEEPRAFTRRLKKHCRKSLLGHQVPARVRVIGERQHGDRFKKLRSSGPAADSADSE